MSTYSRGGVVAFALAVLMRCAVAVTEHHVGSGTCDADPSWSLASTCDFNAWSQKQDFVVNDTIVFTFTFGSSNVAVVTKSDYFTCKSTGVTPSTTTAYSVWTISPVTLVFPSAGTFYFISEMDSACTTSNLKMAVTVKTAAGDAVAPSTSPPAADANPTVIAAPAPSSPSSHHKSSIVAPVVGSTVGFVFLVAKLALVAHCHKKKLEQKRKDRLEDAQLKQQTSSTNTPVVNVHIHADSLKGTPDNSAKDPPSMKGTPDNSAKGAPSNV